MNEMIYIYDGTFEGLLCCIFDSYANKEVLTAITNDEDAAPTLFPTRAISTDAAHAARVLRKLHKLSPWGEELVRRGYLTCMEDKEIHIYRLVAKLLREGPGFLRDFSDETLHPVAAAIRHLNGEAHLLKGFVRFSELGGVLGSFIHFNTEGLDFVMTAMFAVIFLEQWLKEKHHASEWIGLAASVGCLLLFGADNFLVPTMICILAALTALRRPLEKERGVTAP